MANLLALLVMPLVVVLGMAYFLPTLIAAVRGHHSLLALALLNLFLGWTLLGWLLALAWAIGGRRR